MVTVPLFATIYLFTVKSMEVATVSHQIPELIARGDRKVDVRRTAVLLSGSVHEAQPKVARSANNHDGKTMDTVRL